MTSISFSSYANYGVAGQLGYAAGQIASTSATLTRQATDGLVSDQVGKLGTATGAVLNLQPQLAQLSAYATNGSVAGTRLQVAATSLTQLGSVAQDVATNLLALQGENGTAAQTTLATMVSQAKSALGEVGTLLNTQAAGSYVFGGGDGSTAPVTDPTNMTGNAGYAATASAVAGLDANGAAATLQSILTAASATTTGATPFAGNLPAGAQTVMVGAGTSVATSIPIATATGTAGATSTGSSARDLVAVLTTIANLSPSDLSSANIGGLLSGLSAVATNAQNGLIQQGADIGANQDVVTSTLAFASSTSTLMTTQLGDLTSVDVAKVSTELSASNEQLQASYMLISDLKGLSLADYL
jgi:flagellar hook-associated protein 3 FlgL